MRLIAFLDPERKIGHILKLINIVIVKTFLITLNERERERERE